MNLTSRNDRRRRRQARTFTFLITMGLLASFMYATDLHHELLPLINSWFDVDVDVPSVPVASI